MDDSYLIEAFETFFSRNPSIVEHVIKNYPKDKGIYIDYVKFSRIFPDVASLLFSEPERVLKTAEIAFKNLGVKTSLGEEMEVHARFTNIDTSKMLIEEINSRQINTLVAFRGVITKRAEPLYKVLVAVYRCAMCGNEVTVPITKEFNPPTKCPSCQAPTLTLDEEKSKYIDVQRAEVQELLERVKGNSPAAKIELYLEDDLVNRFYPGDNVDVIGILKLRTSPSRKRKGELIYSKYVHVINISPLHRDFEQLRITKEEEREIKRLASLPNIKDLIIDSIAPHIYGYREVKHAIALQLFGGRKGKRLISGAKVRADIHILLIGDPGIAKTRFLEAVKELAPKAIYVSGKTVSGVGLTAAVEKDDLSDGGWTLKAGALILANGGIVCIDEFDKIDDSDRAVLHEAMETQTISIAKAGIVGRFKAQTSILAAANPRFGRFNPNKSLVEQFDIPPSLLSRFDLIFPIVDVLDEKKDAELAEYILQQHKAELKPINVINRELIKKYISYARKNIHPVLSEEASSLIKRFYVELRKKGKEWGTVPITPRYLEGLVRLAEANAKMRLSNVVTEEDARDAIHLMNYVMKRVMSEGGKIDVDITAVGKSSSERAKLETILDVIERLCNEFGNAEEDKILEEAKEHGIDEKEARRLVDQLHRMNKIYKIRAGVWRIVEEI